jgi:hypothetical protein
MFDLRAAYFGLGANRIHLRTNLIANPVPNPILNAVANPVLKELNLFSRLLLKHFALNPRHLGRIRGRHQTVHRSTVPGRQKSRSRQRLLGARRHPAQRQTGVFSNPMQRHKTSMLIFATQAQRQRSNSDPISGLIRVHGKILTVWTVGRAV